MRSIDCPKCEHEHAPTGCDEQDTGEFTCEQCGFEFLVEVEYEPSYLTTCVTHKWGEIKVHLTGFGNFQGRFCEYCQAYKSEERG